VFGCGEEIAEKNGGLGVRKPHAFTALSLIF
jgi:hypothetical protein